MATYPDEFILTHPDGSNNDGNNDGNRKNNNNEKQQQQKKKKNSNTYHDAMERACCSGLRAQPTRFLIGDAVKQVTAGAQLEVGVVGTWMWECGCLMSTL